MPEKIMPPSSWNYRPTKKQVRTITNLIKVLGNTNTVLIPSTRLDAHNIIVKLKEQLRRKYEE